MTHFLARELCELGTTVEMRQRMCILGLIKGEDADMAVH